VAKKIKYIGSKAVNKDSLPSFSIFNDSFQTTIFNGGLKLSTVFSNSTPIKRENKIIITHKDVSLSDLKIRNINELNNFIKITNKLKLNLDITNLSSYATYGSLKEKFRFAVNNIINKFPGGLFLDTYVSGISYFNILDYTYDSINDVSVFKTPITIIDNPFFINLYSNSNISSNTIGNLITRFLDYSLLFNNINYGINGFTGFSTSNSSYLYFSINGNPFSGNSSPQNISENFVIKPNDIEFNKFYDGLNDLERYFLNKNSSPKYTFSFKIPQVNEDDELEFIDYNFNFPLKSDGYNLDTDSVNYVNFLESLFEVGDLYDEYKSNLIIRKFIPTSLIDFDNSSSFKSESIFKIYGKEIDEIKTFIDSLMNINNVSYDKINNIPDALIKNLARTLGWNAQNIINDKDLLSSVFGNDRSGDTDITASLAEVDIELWRRLTINTAWFLKSKGTRKSIETIFNFIGAPDCLISFDEHIYVVDAPISLKSLNVSLESVTNTIKVAYDEDGFPINPTFTTTDYFQSNGVEDSGQRFIDIYRSLGYNVTKTVDNKKSWVYYESASTHSSSGRNTNYSINDSRLIINTKEITINIDTAKAIECDVYNFNKEYNYPVSSTGRTSPYPQRESNIFDTTKLSFAEYVQEIYSKFINAQNRKVTDSALGTHYPSLAKLYYDYYQNNNSNKRNFIDLYRYVDKLDNTFNLFVKQFVPATTIFNDTSFNVRNTVFTPQKFTYKHGIDDGSEFQKEIQLPIESETALVTIESEFFDTFENQISVATIEGTVSISDDGSIDSDTFASATQNINLQPLWGGVICENEKSAFLLTGATKIELSSLTQSQIFNKTSETSHTLTFNFTSATSTLSSNTTNFYYALYKYNTSINGFDDTPIYSFKAAGYTAFTATNILNTILSGSVLDNDSEYLVKPYFEYVTCSQSATTFSAISPYNQYDLFLISGYPIESYINLSGNTILYNQSERYFDYANSITNTGSSITTLIPNNEYNPKYRNYNSLDDYYFVSLIEPDKPLLSIQQLNTDQEGLITETFLANTTAFTDFYLQNEPLGDIVVAVNGVTIQRGSEFISNPDTTLTPSIANRAFRLLMRLTSDHNDIITVTYYKKTLINQVKLVKEDLQYTGSSQIVSASSGYYEISLSNQLINSEIGVYYNGIALSKDIDYSISLSKPNTVVLLYTPQNNSVFSVVYLTNANSIGANVIIQPTSLISNIDWTINSLIPSYASGSFIHQFYPLSDTGLTGNTTYTAETAYSFDTNSFTQSFDWSNSSPLVLGTTYYYRLASRKNFKTINNINLSSITYSDTVRIKLPL
jgi:hypothetical protein